MPVTGEIDFVFFDIGGTPGERDAAGRFTPFPSSAGLLRAVRERLRGRLRCAHLSSSPPRLQSSKQ
ncbi:MAG: hypothetical protein ACJ754_09535 [Pyrinomonadaceae bacterium]